MSCFGYHRSTTPALKKVARRAAMFDLHFSHAHNTHPAFTTIFTGKYAETHRVVRMNGEYEIEPGFRMMTQELAKHGVETAAVDDLVSTGAIVKAVWLGKGFKTYVNTRDQAGRSGRLMANIRQLATPMLKELKMKQPFFLFLHPWDTHSPYVPNPPFDRAFYRGDIEGRTNLSRSHQGCDKFRVFIPGAIVDEEDKRYTLSQYDGAIKEVDNEFSCLLEDLQDIGLSEETTVILTSDHGECLGDHRICFGHRWVYDSTTRVPLVIICPRMDKGMRIDRVTQHVDIAPTIFDLLGVGKPADLEGDSLLPLINGEDDHYPYAHLFATYPDLRRGIRTGRHKYIEHLPGCPRYLDWPVRELYDLQRDPLEERNIIDSESDLASELRWTMAEWLKSKLKGRPDPMVEQARQGFIQYDN